MKGQGAFEYVLLLAGILLIVVLAIVILRGGLSQGPDVQIKAGACRSALTADPGCYDVDGFNSNGVPQLIPNVCHDFCKASGDFDVNPKDGFCDAGMITCKFPTG